MRLTTTPPPTSWALAAVAALLVLAFAGSAQAQIDGIPGPTFALAARGGEITSGTFDPIYSWGYASGQGLLQYPGPTLIVTQGDDVTVALTNELPNSQYGSPPPNVSIVFPGQAVTAIGGIEGLLTREAPPGGSVSYSFTAGAPGTYLYHSGTRPELQIEMGLIGALIVRPSAVPAGGAAGTTADHYAYGDAASSFDREALLLLSEMDPRIHSTVELSGTAGLEGNNDLSNPFPAYWFINGRSYPDTAAPSFVPWLPTQPYGSLMRVKPGERLLVRVIGGGRLDHPLHFQGNRVEVIARDGRLLSSSPGAGADLATSVSTLLSAPGETVDAILQWTGAGLGWDIYGPIDTDCTDIDNDMVNDNPQGTLCHDAVCVDADSDGFDDVNKEYCPDHVAALPFPVLLPSDFVTEIGPFYSGSPYLGRFGDLPPGTGGLNLNAGYHFAVGSQNTNELVDNGLPGFGMMTFLIVEPPDVPLPGE